MTTQKTILIAEDDAGIIGLLIELLTEEGYAVQVAASGDDALAALPAEPYDLALVDLHLPGLGGWEVLKALRAQPIDTPIVIMTTDTLDATKLEAAGAHACLYKPFELDDLLECVAQHIRRR
jgi:two-component system response regulator MprA